MCSFGFVLRRDGLTFDALVWIRVVLCSGFFRNTEDFLHDPDGV